MIEVRFRTDQNQRVREVRIQGHAGLSSKGSDVLCAAVSALTYTMRDGIQEILGKEARIRQEEGDFLLELQQDGDAGSELIFATVLKTLQGLAGQYPERLQIRREEDGT
ncbi:MAG: ribosomal-processing cysteine protease Prp [Leptospiraceae bacterium]|nr:ribosomal-processing cysteine protease Prp [Leptospiraceae bacterium]